MHRTKEQFETDFIFSIELEEPKMFKVLLLNDDYSSMEFVIKVLMQVFHHNEEKATEIMFNIHQQGKGLCGVYVFEIAETKVSQVRKMAQEAKFPLRAVMEEA